VLKCDKTSLCVLKFISEVKMETTKFELVFPSLESTIYNALKKCIDHGDDELLILAYKTLRILINNDSLDIN